MYSLFPAAVLTATLLVLPSLSLPTSWPAAAGDVEVSSLDPTTTNVSDLLDFDKDSDDEDEDDFSYLENFNQSLAIRANTVDAYIDCRGIEELCDANCYAILCLGQPQLLTKVDQTQAKRNRQLVGAKAQPFKGTTAQLTNRGLRRPDAQHVSAEEYPFASTSQGGMGADVFPALVSQQNTQRDAIRNMYSSYGVANGQNFNLKFNYANTPYCNALARGDYSVCDKNNGRKRGPGGFDIGFFAFVRNSLKNQNLHFNFVGK